MLLRQPHSKLGQKYVDAIEQHALSQKVSGLSGGGGGTERNRRRVDVHRLDSDLGLRRLAAAAVPSWSVWATHRCAFFLYNPYTFLWLL